MNDYVILNDLADELRLDRSNIRKYISKKNIDIFKVRNSSRGNQVVSALSLEDAEFIRQEREREGFTKNVSAPVENGKGFFYIIQLVPELDPNRIKFGFAGDVAGRLRAHQTSAPTAQSVKSWSCKRGWESAAIASITRTECTLIANEVYTCSDLSSLIKRGDDFFALLPKHSIEIY